MPGGPPIGELTLRQRLPGYVAALGLGLGIAVVAGVAWSALTDAGFREATAWSLMILGALVLLLGGASGSGLAQTDGGYGVHYGRHHEGGAGDTDAEIARMRDLKNRLASNLRPRRNPSAFWQVIGGLGYLGLGLLLVQGT